MDCVGADALGVVASFLGARDRASVALSSRTLALVVLSPSTWAPRLRVAPVPRLAGGRAGGGRLSADRAAYALRPSLGASSVTALDVCVGESDETLELLLAVRLDRTAAELTIRCVPAAWTWRAAAAFGLLRRLAVDSALSEGELRALGAALAAGAWPRLESLSIVVDARGSGTAAAVYAVSVGARHRLRALCVEAEGAGGTSSSDSSPSSSDDEARRERVPLEAVLLQCTSLEGLCLRRAEVGAGPALLAAAGALSIRSLTLDRCSGVAGGGLAAVVSALPSLECLTVRQPDGAPSWNAAARRLAGRLVSLTVESCAAFSGEALVGLSRGGRLRKLCVAFCPNVCVDALCAAVAASPGLCTLDYDAFGAAARGAGNPSGRVLGAIDAGGLSALAFVRLPRVREAWRLLHALRRCTSLEIVDWHGAKRRDLLALAAQGPFDRMRPCDTRVPPCPCGAAHGEPAPPDHSC